MKRPVSCTYPSVTQRSVRRKHEVRTTLQRITLRRHLIKLSMAKKKDSPQDSHLRFIDNERRRLNTRTEKQIEDARLLLSSEPVRGHLLSLVDELVRQGIYLPLAKQEGAKLMIELIGTEIEKGDMIRLGKPKKK